MTGFHRFRAGLEPSDSLESLSAGGLSLDQVVSSFGDARVRAAAMHDRIRELVRRPRSRGYPPWIFISYRWEGPEAKAWVRRLADRLRERGFRVHLDQDELPVSDVGPHGIEIGRFVAQIVDCHYFLRVVTRGLAVAANHEWIGEESQLAGWLSEFGQVQIDLVKEWPAPDAEENSFQVSLEDVRGYLHQGKTISILEQMERKSILVVDISQDPGDLSALDQVLDYRGLTLSKEEEEQLVCFMEQAAPLLDARDGAKLFGLLQANAAIADTDEWTQVFAHAYALAGRTKEAATFALNVLEMTTPLLETKWDMCLLLWDLGRKATALHYMCAMRILGGRFDLKVTGMIADILDDLGCHFEALNFYQYALALARNQADKQIAFGVANELRRASRGGRPDDRMFREARAEARAKYGNLPAWLLNDTAYVYLFRFGDGESALPLLQEAIQSDPAHVNAWINLIAALVTLRREKEAVKVQLAARELFPAEPRLRWLPPPIEVHLAIPAASHECGTCRSQFRAHDGFLCGHCGAACGHNRPCAACGHRQKTDTRCPVCGASSLRRR
ncbi:TIR domain-containing protein [Catelliglobosispora koreensis]|uniref:TIR domain-containing protein n=1 Tax=Catelliglobosispora koreensis TaxID=129052 RepID=UPI0012FC489D|nr:TIR domain-containing protein [Catelliglobosispora koreensis]